MRKSQSNGPMPISFVAPDITEALLPVVVTDPPPIQCKKCREWKRRTEEFFYRHKKRNWWQSWCKECQKQRMVLVRAARKAESLHSPLLNSPRATATLKYLRRQLDIATKEETKVLKAITACRDTRVRIEQAIAALLRLGE